MDIKKKFNEMSVLAPLLTIYTLVYLGLMIYDFAIHPHTYFQMSSKFRNNFLLYKNSNSILKFVRK
jgi:hypothetical protein